MLSEKLKRFHDLCRWSTPAEVVKYNEIVEDELDGMVWVGAYECNSAERGDEGVREFTGTLDRLANIYEEMELSWEVLRARFPRHRLPDFEEV